MGIPRRLHDDYKMLRIIPPGLGDHLVLDVGACEGWFARCWLHYNPYARMACFEPSTETFMGKLVPAVEADTRVTLENCGVGEISGTRTLRNFEFYKSNSFLDPGSDFDLKRLDSQSSERVAVIRLDDYLREKKINKIKLIKIDVQGFELEVIRGLGSYLNNVDYIYIEASIHPLYETKPTFCEIFEKLFSSGFFLQNMEVNSFGTGILRECNMLFANRRVVSTKKLVV